MVVTITAEHLREIKGMDIIPAHMVYRVCKGPHLYRTNGINPPKGGFMGISAESFNGGGEPAVFCQEVVRECVARGMNGAVCDFPKGGNGTLEHVVTMLGEGFHKRNWTLYVPERYGHCSPHVRVMISSALSGGTLERRLSTCGEKFGVERMALSLERMAEDFFLPSPTGCGVVLTPEELAEKVDGMAPSVFFSRELCARYFTYMNRDNGAHFVLFDDGGTMRHKMELARRLGLCGIVAPWAEIEPWAEELGLVRNTP